MNRYIRTMIGLVLIFCIFHYSAEVQIIKNNNDSLRVEMQELIENAGELLSIGTASAVDSAKIVLDSVIEIVKKDVGSYDTLLAKAYNRLSSYYHKKSEFDSSITMAQETLDILEKIPGGNHLIALPAYNLLVEGYLHKTDLVNCEKYSDLRIEILNKLDKPLKPSEAEHMAEALNDRARLSYEQNRKDEAIQYLEKGLSFIPDGMEWGPRLRADMKGNIAWILSQENEFEESNRILIEVLELMKQIYHSKHPNVVYTTHLLSMNARMQRDYNRADSLMDIVIELSEDAYGKSHISLQDYYQAKSYLLLARDKPEEAVEIAMRAVALNRKFTGDYPTNMLRGSLGIAGNVAMAAGQWELANELFEELLQHKHSFLNTVFGYASESQKLNYLTKYPPIIKTFLSGTIKSAEKKLHQTAANMIFRGKGMAIDAIAAEHAAAICSSDPLLDSLIKERQNICEEIAGLFLSSRGQEDKILELLDELNARKNKIETDLSLYCSGMQLDYSNDNVSVETVAGKMPEQSVLWEFIKYDRVNLERLYEYDTTVNQSYLAMVLTPDANITVIDLGDASLIDRLIDQYHNIMSDALKAHLSDDLSMMTEQYLETAAGLYEDIVAPLEATLQGAQIIFMAPDGLLNLLPFETLTKDGRRFLIEDHQFVYLTSGRDILREKPDLGGRDALVIADPDFMIDPKELPTLASSEFSSSYALRGNPTPAECLESMFSPLPMTRQEGMSVAGLLGESGRYDITYLDSNLARESALKNLSQPPDILHIATHGYFCQPDTNSLLSNPLLRSGLILAGANRTIGGMNGQEYTAEDGILTAMEVSALNLIGTDLTILSACQTGMGEVQSGEGVFGLRRAFQHAGVRSMIMSMFAVPDESTSYFMERFYNNWLSGSSKATSLRNASLSIIKELREEKGFAHPLFWGGFVLAGNPD